MMNAEGPTNMRGLQHKLPPKTDKDRLNDLIDWYEEHKPEAGQRIQVDKGPRDLKRMLDLPSTLNDEREYTYRGRTIVAIGKDRER